MTQSVHLRRNKATTRIVIESSVPFTLRISASREHVTATAAGDVTIESAGSNITVAIVELAPGRRAKDARVYVPADLVVELPGQLAQIDDEIRQALGVNLVEQ